MNLGTGRHLARGCVFGGFISIVLVCASWSAQPIVDNEELYKTAIEHYNALDGLATVKDITVLRQSTERADVQMTMFMRVDIDKDGRYREETSNLTCELHFRYDKWRIFNCSTK